MKSPGCPPAIAQRWNRNLDDVQPIVEIFAEVAGRNAREQVAIGRGDDPDVGSQLHAIGADRMNFARLEETQQHALHARRHLAQFVEEERAAIGHRRETRFIAIGAGETAAHVTKELGLEKIVGESGAVHREERVPATRAARMNQPRDDFLADAGLSSDQDFRFGSS